MARGGMSRIMTIGKRRNTTIFKSLDLLLIYKDDGGSENSLTFTTKVIYQPSAIIMMSGMVIITVMSIEQVERRLVLFSFNQG